MVRLGSFPISIRMWEDLLVAPQAQRTRTICIRWPNYCPTLHRYLNLVVQAAETFSDYGEACECIAAPVGCSRGRRAQAHARPIYRRGFQVSHGIAVGSIASPRGQVIDNPTSHSNERRFDDANCPPGIGRYRNHGRYCNHDGSTKLGYEEDTLARA